MQNNVLHSPTAKAPYPGNARPFRSLSAESIPRSAMRNPPPPLIHAAAYMSPQHGQQLLPSPSHGPTALPLQPCVSPMQPIMPTVTLSPDYPPIATPLFAPDIHSAGPSTSPMNQNMVLAASPNNAIFDVNAKWDHLFQGGGIFEMSSVFGIDSEFGNLTPPDLSVCISSPVEFNW